ncbi:MAG: hypothetical protein KAT37_01840 [Candidatus Aenigmarchaeota archaeon]|nr:hypothetical protein [Candidatus Aenigmarchaeota archaeon]
MKEKILVILLILVLISSGCVSVEKEKNENPEPELNPPSDDTVAEDLQSPIKPIYHTVEKSGFYEDGQIKISWTLEDEATGFNPSNEKYMCIRLVEFPNKFFHLGDDVLVKFDKSGDLKHSVYTNEPGKYVFKICGLGRTGEFDYVKGDYEFIDEGTYAGDGDEIEVIVPEKPKIYIGESSYSLIGPSADGRYYAIEFKWDLEFFNKSTEGTCALVGHNLVETRFIQSNVGGGYRYSNTWKCSGNTLIAKADSVEADFDGPITVKVSLYEFPDHVIYEGDGDEIVAIVPKRERV